MTDVARNVLLPLWQSPFGHRLSLESPMLKEGVGSLPTGVRPLESCPALASWASPGKF